MNNLERAKQLAQRTANQDGAPVVVLNLNPYAPLYVVRVYRAGIETARDYVCTVAPQAAS